MARRPQPNRLEEEAPLPAKSTVTWLGEDDNPAEETVFMGIAFRKSDPVETDNARLIERARANRFFTVA